ncbi:hypothetical protein ACFVYT_28140 [Streptomyces sp. NPDC058290]|uniref:hypothetical protein n=1 Tax=Streptomyces sp. NPDC058290 TaxID=3346426 RepID=UPI0036E90088
MIRASVHRWSAQPWTSGPRPNSRSSLAICLSSSLGRPGDPRLEALVRNRLKRLQYLPDTLDGFIAGTGLTLDKPTSP